MTYHSHSDVPVPYGRVVKRGEQEQQQQQIRNYHGEKVRGVAILASNCGGSSGRFKYLDKLVQSLQVLYTV